MIKHQKQLHYSKNYEDDGQVHNMKLAPAKKTSHQSSTQNTCGGRRTTSIVRKHGHIHNQGLNHSVDDSHQCQPWLSSRTISGHKRERGRRPGTHQRGFQVHHPRGATSESHSLHAEITLCQFINQDKLLLQKVQSVHVLVRHDNMDLHNTKHVISKRESQEIF